MAHFSDSEWSSIMIAFTDATHCHVVLHVLFGKGTQPRLRDARKIEPVTAYRKVARDPKFAQIPDLFLCFWSIIVGISDSSVQNAKEANTPVLYGVEVAKLSLPAK